MTGTSGQELFSCAVADIGANSVRMNVYEIDTGTGKTRVADSARSLLGLASYVENGRLSADGQGKLFAVMRDFLLKVNEVPCDDFRVFATASLRGISNSGDIIKRLSGELGINVEIISGEREAEYDFSAVRQKFGNIMADTGAVIDMGGGSTEIVSFSGGAVTSAVSLGIGCLMLVRDFAGNDKKRFPAESIRERMRGYALECVGRLPDTARTGGTAYLIGGTARAMFALYAALFPGKGSGHGCTMTAEEFRAMKKAVITDSENGGRLIFGTVPERAPTVIPGIVAYGEIFEYLGIEKLTLSLAGVREGYINEYTKRFSV